MGDAAPPGRPTSRFRVRLYNFVRTYFIKNFWGKLIKNFLNICDASLSILRHDELQIWGLGTVGALTIRADGLRTWGDLDCLGHWGTSSFQPTSQTVRQPNPKPTDWPFCQPASLSTTTALANRSGIFHLRPCWVSGATVDKTASPMTTGRRIQRYILVVRPARLLYIRLMSALAQSLGHFKNTPPNIPPPLRSGGFQPPQFWERHFLYFKWFEKVFDWIYF